ncbi:DUF192 domain-containing protein [Thalassovita sp.]|jgi:uncharacterized membrane protein (UPF0127 family)|uniref:DUF192 domain-containing protein n=1 Tax=Thalassovita sp. TaxID=1979401 RepID=UPI003B58B711
MSQVGRQIKRALWLLAFCFLAPALAMAECRTETVFLKGDWGQARFAVEVADTASERAVGLMYREKMPRMAGMLFVYPSAQRVSFWMRDTYIPLDMFFLNEAGIVTRIHENAVPLDETPIPGGDDIKFVLELNAGMAKRLGIATGSLMRHPSVEASRAAWPCR